MSTVEIYSPLPGTFYSKAAPDQPDFVQVGDNVSVGQVIGLIEVMKQYNELTSEVAGKVVALEIQNGDEVDAGQVVAVIEA